MSNVTTFTAMSVHDRDQGTLTITSKVVESVESALGHLRSLSAMYAGVEPVYGVSARGWRWSWETVSESGKRCTDTVWIF